MIPAFWFWFCSPEVMDLNVATSDGSIGLHVWRAVIRLYARLLRELSKPITRASSGVLLSDVLRCNPGREGGGDGGRAKAVENGGRSGP